jgi:hypothetical protein
VNFHRNGFTVALWRCSNPAKSLLDLSQVGEVVGGQAFVEWQRQRG